MIDRHISLRLMEAQHIRLDQYLKLVGVVNSGGEAKHRIQNSEVRVNGETETRRGRKLVAADLVEIDNKKFTVSLK